MRLGALALATASLTLLAAPVHAGTASGRFKVGDAVISPTAATAYEVREQNDASRRSIEIMLGVAPLDAAEVAAALDPHTYAINSDAAKQGDYILLWVKPDGDVTMNATFSETMSQYIAMSEEGLKAELTENTPQRVAGRVRTAKPVKTMSGESYEVDVTFAAEVVRPPAGKKLGPDGGEPGKALEALYKAVAKKDWTAIKAGVSAGRSIEADYKTAEENLADAVDMLGNYWLPKKHKILGGELRGDVAVLEVQGEIYEGRNAIYLVEMVKGEQGWQYQQSVPAGLLKK